MPSVTSGRRGRNFSARKKAQYRLVDQGDAGAKPDPLTYPHSGFGIRGGKPRSETATMDSGSGDEQCKPNEFGGFTCKSLGKSKKFKKRCQC